MRAPAGGAGAGASAAGQSAPRTLDDPADVAWGAGGLVPAIAQDARDGRVLMVAWQDAEALAATLATGELHFHSRSRARLWRKGETSGNVLRLRSIALDCDGDAILLQVEPAGPACHTGARSCFETAPSPTDAIGPGPTVSGRGFGLSLTPVPGDADSTEADSPAPGGTGFVDLDSLWAIITQRASDRPEGSYTARLLEGGVDSVGRKVAEEAVEVVMAAKDDAFAEASGSPPRDQAALAGELADLLYHTLVLMAERGVSPAAVMQVLRERRHPR